MWKVTFRLARIQVSRVATITAFPTAVSSSVLLGVSKGTRTGSRGCGGHVADAQGTAAAAAADQDGEHAAGGPALALSVVSVVGE